MMSRNRPKQHAILGSPVTLGLALVALFFLGRAALGIHEKSANSEMKLAEAKANLDKLTATKDRITRELQSISTDAGIKAEIREKYHAVGPGESVAVIVDGEAAAGNTGLSQSAASSTTAKIGFWRGFLRMIGLRD